MWKGSACCKPACRLKKRRPSPAARKTRRIRCRQSGLPWSSMHLTRSIFFCKVFLCLYRFFPPQTSQQLAKCPPQISPKLATRSTLRSASLGAEDLRKAGRSSAIGKVAPHAQSAQLLFRLLLLLLLLLLPLLPLLLAQNGATRGKKRGRGHAIGKVVQGAPGAAYHCLRI